MCDYDFMKWMSERLELEETTVSELIDFCDDNENANELIDDFLECKNKEILSYYSALMPHTVSRILKRATESIHETERLKKQYEKFTDQYYNTLIVIKGLEARLSKLEE